MPTMKVTQPVEPAFHIVQRDMIVVAEDGAVVVVPAGTLIPMQRPTGSMTVVTNWIKD